jgi:hypothetical protein
MTLTATQLKEMNDTTALLERWYTEASTKTAGIWFFPFIGTADSIDGALYTARRSIDYMKSDLRLEVASGFKPWSTWTLLAQATRNNLATVLKNIPALSFSGVSGDLATGVKNAALFALGGTTFLVFAVLAVFLLVGLRR